MLLAVRAFRPDDLNTYVQRVEKLLGHHTHDEPQDQHWCDIGLGKAEPTSPGYWRSGRTTSGWPAHKRKRKPDFKAS